MITTNLRHVGRVCWPLIVGLLYHVADEEV